MLQGVVDDGSGHFAQISGYTVGGKTGTSQKVDPKSGTYGGGGYVMLIAVDELVRPATLTQAARAMGADLQSAHQNTIVGGVGLDALTRKLRESLALV